jgi:hypothetical protein
MLIEKLMDFEILMFKKNYFRSSMKLCIFNHKIFFFEKIFLKLLKIL